MRWPNLSAPGWVAGRAHVVGQSLGAQVGVQLLATEPELVDRAVLCGTIVDAMPVVRLTALLLGLVARISRSVIIRRNARLVGIPSANVDDHARMSRLMPAAQVAHLVEASAGSHFPRDSTNRIRPHCFSPVPTRCGSSAARRQRSLSECPTGSAGWQSVWTTTGRCAIRTSSPAPSTAGSPVPPCLWRSHCRTRVVADQGECCYGEELPEVFIPCATTHQSHRCPRFLQIFRVSCGSR